MTESITDDSTPQTLPSWGDDDPRLYNRLQAGLSNPDSEPDLPVSTMVKVPRFSAQGKLDETGGTEKSVQIANLNNPPLLLTAEQERSVALSRMEFTKANEDRKLARIALVASEGDALRATAMLRTYADSGEELPVYIPPTHEKSA